MTGKPGMFTFLHAADVHLDSPLVGLAQREGAPVATIRGATRAALGRLVDLAVERRVGFVVIAGDLYDGDWRDFQTGLFFVDAMRRLERAAIPVYLIHGNHDAESRITKSLTLPGNVHVFPTKRAGTIEHESLPVAVHGQSFATAAVTENLAAGYPPAVAGKFNVGVLHTNLGDRAGHGNYAPSTVAELVGHGYDYWALGHIHQRGVHHEGPHVVYAGNPQGRHVNETGAKGCYLVSVSGELAVAGLEFCELDGVRWEHLEVGCADLEDEAEVWRAVGERLRVSLEAVGERLLAVRISLTGFTGLHERLRADPGRVEAECVSVAAEVAGDRIWIESVRVRTRTLIDPRELAKRDDLTALVLEGLGAFDPASLPAGTRTLESKLPGDVAAALRTSLRPEGADEVEAMRADVAALVLRAIATSD